MADDIKIDPKGQEGTTPPAQSGDPKATEPKEPAKEPVKEAPKEYTLKTPEGFDAEQSVIDGLKALGLKHSLSNEGLQGTLDFIAGLEQGKAKAHKEAVEALHKQWDEALKADIDFGGANYDANMKKVAVFIEKYVPKELTETFVASGFNKNAYLNKFYHNIGKLLADDKFVEMNPVNKKPRNLNDFIQENLNRK